MPLKRRNEMTAEELKARELRIKCLSCGSRYVLLPVCADTDEPGGYYSSDRDHCKDCGSSDMIYDHSHS